ncbi:hypothetical protein GGS23DRAFT_543055 [Durotheca rogersii]|uniref:uncharacterized protein n=1 Tax=Durotheca rogersii TaxID=419775 RepID=UPI00221FC84F|nr:uncharacterized protein GGS23DRAFT_543055 [Durotheca rogersii]KAI5867899.1 hypothetical protein GGS23DRAFT_543055 [Durotheca rogersii]
MHVVLALFSRGRIQLTPFPPLPWHKFLQPIPIACVGTDDHWQYSEWPARPVALAAVSSTHEYRPITHRVALHRAASAAAVADDASPALLSAASIRQPGLAETTRSIQNSSPLTATCTCFLIFRGYRLRNDEKGGGADPPPSPLAFPRFSSRKQRSAPCSTMKGRGQVRSWGGGGGGHSVYIRMYIHTQMCACQPEQGQQRSRVGMPF